MIFNSTNPGLRANKQRIFILFATLLLVSAAACDGGCGSSTGSKTVPKTATARITNMAGHLPPSTQVSFVVGDLEGMRTSLKTTRDSLGDAVPMTGLIEQQAKSELGIDIFDAKSWENSGIAANGGMTLGVVGTRPVMLTYVDDTQKFEKNFADQLKKSMGVEGMPKTQTTKETQVKVLGSDADSIAWAYNGKLVAVAFPETEEIKDYASAEKVESAADLAATLATQDPKTSLGAEKGFQRFQKALANDQAMAIYINPETVFNPANVETMTGGDDNSKAAVTWAQNNIDALGLALNVKDNSLAIKTWAALPDSTIKKAKAILSAPTEFPIGNFATEHTLIALRQSFDMQKLWAFYTEDVLNEEQLAELNARTGQISSKSDFDLQKDLIANLTGNYAVLLYGVDPNAVQAAGGDPVNAVMRAPMQTLALLAPIQFKDKAGLNKLVEYMLSEAGEGASRTPVKDGVDVIVVEGMSDTAGRFLVKDDLLVYATSPINNDAVVKYINGKRDEKPLGDGTALNLGKSMGSDDVYNGLYLNFVRAQDHLLPQLGMAAAMVEPFLVKLEEAALTTELGDDGAFLELTIDLNPDAPKPDTAAEPSK